MSIPFISVGLMLVLIGMIYECFLIIPIGIAVYALAVFYYFDSKDEIDKRIDKLEKEIKELKSK